MWQSKPVSLNEGKVFVICLLPMDDFFLITLFKILKKFKLVIVYYN